MKKTPFIIAVLLIVLGVVFVSCSKDEETTKPSTTPQEEEDPNDVSHFNIIPYVWTLTQLQSDGMNEFVANMINQALASGNLLLSFSGETGGVETEYAGWEMHVAYNTTNLLNFNVQSYSPQTQEIVISNTTSTYGGEATITKDDYNIYMDVATTSVNSQQSFNVTANIPIPE